MCLRRDQQRKCFVAFGMMNHKRIVFFEIEFTQRAGFGLEQLALSHLDNGFVMDYRNCRLLGFVISKDAKATCQTQR